jgi:hypothetical protein
MYVEYIVDIVINILVIHHVIIEIANYNGIHVPEYLLDSDVFVGHLETVLEWNKYI